MGAKKTIAILKKTMIRNYTYTCVNEKPISLTALRKARSPNGFETETAVYSCKDCDGRGSYRGNSYGRYPDMGYGSYDDGTSCARGRRNARRDSMGRYSRNDGYCRADGKEEYIENLRDMMNTAPNERTHMSI